MLSLWEGQDGFDTMTRYRLVWCPSGNSAVYFYHSNLQQHERLLISIEKRAWIWTLSDLRDVAHAGKQTTNISHNHTLSAARIPPTANLTALCAGSASSDTRHSARAEIAKQRYRRIRCFGILLHSFRFAPQSHPQRSLSFCQELANQYSRQDSSGPWRRIAITRVPEALFG